MSNTSLSIWNIIYNEESLFFTEIHLKIEVLRYSCSYLWNIEQLSAVYMQQIWCCNIVVLHFPVLHPKTCVLYEVYSKQ